MDLNGDGKLDLLSGSYAHKGNGKSGGYISVCWALAAPSVLKGDDDTPLTIAAPAPGDYATRPFAVDLNGDGKLDLVVGNMMGNFAVFAGLGEGRFSAKHRWLRNDVGEELKVAHKSDPFFIDWDGDGDQDMLTGSNLGGVYLYRNAGSVTKAVFGAPKQLLPPAPRPSPTVRHYVFGDKHLTVPQFSTRVWAADINGDGKLDLLIGDHGSRHTRGKGLDDDALEEALDDWDNERANLAYRVKQTRAAIPWWGDKDLRRIYDEAQKALRKFEKTRDKIMRSESAGHVWLALQK